jgi:hypothetical protein
MPAGRKTISGAVIRGDMIETNPTLTGLCRKT